MPFIFNGQLVQRPQSVSRVDDSALIGAGLGGAITVGLLGQATGGQPNTPLEFFSAAEARSTLIAGLLPDAVDLACAPNGEAGAVRIIAVRLDGDPAIPANRAVRAELTLLDGAAQPAILVTSADWGGAGNTTAITIGAGTETGQKITISWRGTDVVGDNLGIAALDIQYIGTGSACSLAVSATALTTSVTGAVADNLNLTFANYPTLRALVDAIVAAGTYDAQLVALNPDMKTTDLDVVAAADIMATPVTLRADLAAQLNFFASLNGEIATATKLASGQKAADLPKTPLAGGVEPVITAQSWGQGLEAISLEDVQVVVPLTGDAAIHASVRTHCVTLSGVLQKRERRAIVGGVAGETLAQAKGRALALNSDRVQLIWPGLMAEQPDSAQLVVRPPFLVAAQKAGLSAGLSPGTSATYEFLAGAGLEVRLTPTQLDQSNAAAICTVEFVPRLGQRIVQDKTTWQQDTRLSRIEFSTALALDIISARCRAVGDQLIGQPATPKLQHILVANLSGALNQMAAEGLLVGDADNPPYRNMQVVMHADIVEVKVEVAVSVPANYIAITITPRIASGAV